MEVRRSQKSVIVTLLGVVVLVVSLGGAGCAPTGDGGEGQWEMPNSTGNGAKGPPGMPWGEGEPAMPNDVLARVAEILGMDQQSLEDAFSRAQTEIGDATPGDSSREAIMTRTAEILEIEQQDLQDAFAQAKVRWRMKHRGREHLTGTGHHGVLTRSEALACLIGDTSHYTSYWG